MPQIIYVVFAHCEYRSQLGCSRSSSVSVDSFGERRVQLVRDACRSTFLGCSVILKNYFIFPKCLTKKMSSEQSDKNKNESTRQLGQKFGLHFNDSDPSEQQLSISKKIKLSSSSTSSSVALDGHHNDHTSNEENKNVMGNDQTETSIFEQILSIPETKDKTSWWVAVGKIFGIDIPTFDVWETPEQKSLATQKIIREQLERKRPTNWHSQSCRVVMSKFIKGYDRQGNPKYYLKYCRNHRMKKRWNG